MLVEKVLRSILEIACRKCKKKIEIRYSVNVGAVWGQMSTGWGQKHLNEVLAAIIFPSMTLFI